MITSPPSMPEHTVRSKIEKLSNADHELKIEPEQDDSIHENIELGPVKGPAPLIPDSSVEDEDVSSDSIGLAV